MSVRNDIIEMIANHMEAKALPRLEGCPRNSPLDCITFVAGFVYLLSVKHWVAPDLDREWHPSDVAAGPVSHRDSKGGVLRHRSYIC
jgi:hypothetical protein